MRYTRVSSRFPPEYPGLAESFLKTRVRFRTHKRGNFLEDTRVTPAWKRFPAGKHCGKKVSWDFLQVSSHVSSGHSLC
jgi:hypothetical protein